MRKILLPLGALVLLCLLAFMVYNLPPVHSRLAWRVDELVLRIKYTLNPPEEVVFVPQNTTAATPPPSATPSPTATATATVPGPTETPAPSPSPTITPTPLPPLVSLKGVRYEDQHGRWNYCAPATLSMALSYWGWKGDRDVVGPYLKPDEKDKNVMPYEMVAYIQEQTDLKVSYRVGGDLNLIKRFVAAGFPVLVEKGTYLTDLTGVKSWMGHYEVVTGFDDEKSLFITQDSFTGPDFEVDYETMTKSWRSFNFTYLIIYSADKEAEVLALLGPDADETTNWQNAARKASDEINALTGIDQYFAWFNRGSSLVQLQDYAGGATSYDEAFAVYPSIPEAERPWRMLWYQTGPYFAYFYSGRYWDVLSLAETTLSAMQSDKNLEESYYWRGMAKAALGDTTGAVADYQASVKYHEGFAPALFQLNQLGAGSQ